MHGVGDDGISTPDNRGRADFPADWIEPIYADLRRLAQRYMSNERGDHTLQATALVHEAFLRLSNLSVDASDPAALRGLAARTMRNVLVDHARRRGAAKRRGEIETNELDEERTSDPVEDPVWDELIALDQSLERLAKLDERRARIVELRFFAGWTVSEVAELLGVSVRTVNYDSASGCEWLRTDMGHDEA